MPSLTPPASPPSSHRSRSPLLQSFLESFRAFPIGDHDKIVVAVSGGPDSVCLLYLFRETLAMAAGIYSGDRLHVAHLNHGFRPEADDEAAFVEALCQSWGIPNTIGRRPVAAICQEKRLSKQEGARLVRYAFLQEVADSHQARWIATGHTADDTAETFLINLIRGAGGEGLSGIPRVREETIIRPMLHLARKDILAELHAKKIPYREDPSNNDRRFLRNRIRHELMPLLGAINPKIKKTLIRTAILLEAENHFLNEQMAAAAAQYVRRTPQDAAFDLSGMGSLHKAIQRRLIRWGIRHLQGGAGGMGFHHIETILRIASGPSTKPVILPRGLSVQKRENTLWLTRRIIEKPSPEPFEIPSVLLQHLSPETTVLDVPSWAMQLLWAREEQAIGSPHPLKMEGTQAMLDYDKITLPLEIRGWRSGDLFIPLGMLGRHKKLQDFFVDRKVPKEMRNRVPLLVSPAGIAWIIGYAIDEQYRVTENTKTILRLKVDRLKAEGFKPVSVCER